MARARHKASCPFCWEWLAPARRFTEVFSGEGCEGGRCPCGAYFVLDVTGHGGGQALMDLRALACEGDLDRALELAEGKDYELKAQNLIQFAVRAASGSRRLNPLQPKVWSIKLREP